MDEAILLYMRLYSFDQSIRRWKDLPDWGLLYTWKDCISGLEEDAGFMKSPAGFESLQIRTVVMERWNGVEWYSWKRELGKLLCASLGDLYDASESMGPWPGSETKDGALLQAAFGAMCLALTSS